MRARDTYAFRQAFDLTLDALIVTLKEAQEYLGAGEDGAAIGTLIALEDQYADLQAALRLFRSHRRNS